jgi:hypothetical protein
MKHAKLCLDVRIVQLTANAEMKLDESPYSEGPIKIIDGLYLGCSNTANDTKSLERLGIAAILNVAKECPIDGAHDLRSMSKIKFDWTHDEDLCNTIDKAIEIISHCQRHKVPILVHCLQGVSRSAALIIGYVMKSKQLNCMEAYAFVKHRAPQISPNVSLMAHLHQCEKLWSC